MVKQDRALRTHALVLDAAAEEFAAHGFAGTNLLLVAQRTGLSKGALYGHFVSKAALAAEVTRQFEVSWRELVTAGDDKGSPPAAVLHALLSELTRRLREDVRFIGGLRLVADDARAAQRVPHQFEELRQLLTVLVRRDLADGGAAADGKAMAAGRLLTAVVIGIHHTTVPLPGGQGVELAEDIWDALLPMVCRPVS